MIAYKSVLIAKFKGERTEYLHSRWTQRRFDDTPLSDLYNDYNMFCRYTTQENGKWTYLLTAKEFKDDDETGYDVEWYQKRQITGKYKNIW